MTNFEIEANDDNFEKEVIAKSMKVPVVVDFFATWCMPCNMLSPILEKMAEKYKGKFVLVKMNVDDAQETSNKYNVSGIPAVKMFRKGKVVDDFVGAIPEEFLKKWIERNLE